MPRVDRWAMARAATRRPLGRGVTTAAVLAAAVALTGTLVTLGGVGLGLGAPVAHARATDNGRPVLFDPTTNAAPIIHLPPAASGPTTYTGPVQTIAHGGPLPMPPGAVALTAGQSAQFVGGDGAPEGNVPVLPPAMALHARGPHLLDPLAGPPGNFPFQTAQSADGLVLIHYYYQPSSFAGGFLNMVQQALQNYVQPTLGYTIISQVNIYIYNSRADFLAGAQPENPNTTGAFSEFAPSRIYMPLDYSSDDFATLSHELTHITLHQQVDVGHLQSDFLFYPVWLDEGLAASDQPGDSGQVNHWTGLLQQALASRGFIDIFRTFVWDYPTTLYSDDLSYAEARAFVKYIEATYGTAKFHGFIGDIKDGDIVFASEANFGVDPQTLQSQWEVSLGLPALKHGPPTLPAVETPSAYFPGHLTGTPNQTRPFAVGGGDGWLLTALILAASAAGVVLLDLGVAGLLARRARKRYNARRAALALAPPPSIEGSLPPDTSDAVPPAQTGPSATSTREAGPQPGKPRSPLTRIEQLALALVVPVTLGVGLLWTRLDPAQSWERDYLAGAAAAILVALGIGVLAWRAWRAERSVVSSLVGLIVLVALAAGAAYTGLQAGIAQGAAYESANAYALAFQTLSAARAPRTDLMRVQTEWATAAYSYRDYPAATQHYRAAVALAAAPAEARDDRSTLTTLTTEWGAQLVGAQLYDQAAQVYASQLASPSCDKACRATLADADGVAYLAWANNLIVTKQVDSGLARLRDLTLRLPGIQASISAQHVLDNNGKGLAAAWAVGKAGDATAMNLLLEIFSVQTSDPTQQALAAASPEPVTGKLGSNYLYKSVIHLYLLAYHNAQDAEAFISSYGQDNSVFKVSVATDASGNFIVWLPAGYTYVAVWEAPPQNGEDFYVYVGGTTIDVPAFTPLTIDALLTT